MADDIEVQYKGSMLSDDIMLVTSDSPKERLDFAAIEEQILQSTLDKYSNDDRTRTYSVITSETSSNNALTIDKINSLAVNINSDLAKVNEANAYILQATLTDAYMGRAYECIYSNVNTLIKNIYPEQNENDSSEVFEEVKSAINEFNKCINIDKFVRDAVAGTVLEGNYNTYLRLTEYQNDIVSVAIDHYPLPLCYQSDYYINGENLLEFDIQQLRSRLQKTYPKSRKERKAVYFENLEKEVEANYPSEICNAFRNKEQIVRLDPTKTYCVKINNMGKKFGVSPFFKALKPLVILRNIENADVADSKARSKKIIFQKLRKELLGEYGQRKGFVEMEYAHAAAAEALQTNFCLYTAPAFVENLSYVVDESTNDNTVNTVKTYTSRLLTALGISFADSELSSFSAANISVDQLMRTINSISEQVEQLLHKYYKVYLEQLGLPRELAPTVKIIDSEMMDWNLRKDFAKFAYDTLNISRDTAFKLVGLDVDDEKTKRQSENEKGYDSVFTPRQNAYNTNVTNTTDTESTAGRTPSSDDLAKQKFDQTYSKEVR